MSRWAASAKWAAGPALDGRRDMPLAFRLSEGLGLTAATVREFDLVRVSPLRYEPGEHRSLVP